MSMTLSDYLDLITSEHRKRPNFKAVTAAAVAPLAATIGFIDVSALSAWDLDTAIGVQLDQVGEWIGSTRYIEQPLIGLYFSWDDVVKTGWESGYWQGKYDPSTGIIALSDDVYRTVLYAKIASNNWDGTRETVESIWNDAFGDTTKLALIDHQDMSISIILTPIPNNLFIQYLLISGRIRLKPEGVRIREYIVNTDKIFAFDIENDMFAGFDTGMWGELIH